MSNMVGKSALADKKRIRDLMVQADGGDSNAQYELALCYEHGEGVRKDYAIYDNKICTGEESAQCRSCLDSRIASIGYRTVVSRGDAIKMST